MDILEKKCKSKEKVV